MHYETKLVWGSNSNITKTCFLLANFPIYQPVRFDVLDVCS